MHCYFTSCCTLVKLIVENVRHTWMSDSQKTVAQLVFTDRKVTPAINHTRFVQVIENLESHGIYYFDFQA